MAGLVLIDEAPDLASREGKGGARDGAPGDAEAPQSEEQAFHGRACGRDFLLSCHSSLK
jgi:hypothetical protein